jgi:hypothetical protein
MSCPDFSIEEDKKDGKIVSYLMKKGIDLHDVEMTEITTVYHVRRLKIGLQKFFPRMMQNLIKILLFRKEINLACYITVFYQFAIDKEMI